MVLSCSDGDAYRYHTEETEVSITEAATAILNNDYMPVVPTVVTTAETALSWSIGSDTFRKSVSAGTWTFPELELQEGRTRSALREKARSPSGTGRDAYEFISSVCGWAVILPPTPVPSFPSRRRRCRRDAENIDSLTLSAPFNHPYLSAVKPMASTHCLQKRMLLRYLRGGPWMRGRIFIIRIHGPASPALRI